MNNINSIQQTPELFVKTLGNRNIQQKAELFVKTQGNRNIQQKAELFVKTQGNGNIQQKPELFVKTLGNRNIQQKAELFVKPRGNGNIQQKAELFVKPQGNRNIQQKPELFVKTLGNRNIQQKPELFVKTQGNRNIQQKPELFVKTQGNGNIQQKPELFVKPQGNGNIQQKPELFVKTQGNGNIQQKPELFVKTQGNGNIEQKAELFVKPQGNRNIEQKAELFVKPQGNVNGNVNVNTLKKKNINKIQIGDKDGLRKEKGNGKVINMTPRFVYLYKNKFEMEAVYNKNDMDGLSPLSGYEPTYKPKKWNNYSNIKNNNNCYSYAVNNKNHKFGKPQPGYFSGFNHIQEKQYKCVSFFKRILNDIPSVYLTSFKQKCKNGFHKAFFAIDSKKNEHDYHFYRQDKNKLWSHKPGTTNVINYDADYKIIKNPYTANRNYIHYNYDKPCFFFCVNNKFGKTKAIN